MYLMKSAALAEQHKLLKPIIEKIDDLLVSEADPTLVVDIISGLCGKSKAQVESTLNLLVTEGILRAARVVRCQDEQCDTPNELEDGKPPKTCSVCDGRFFKKDKEFVYELSNQGKDERSRVLSGLETKAWPNDVSAYRGRVDTVIVSIKPNEFGAVLKRVDVRTTVVGKRHWNMCRVFSDKAQRSFLIATVKTTGQGNEESYAITRDAIDDFEPKSVLVVGIGGAVPGDLTLGDVVFGNYVHDLTVLEVKADKSHAFSGRGEQLSAHVQALLANLAVALPPSLNDLQLPKRLPMVDHGAVIAGEAAKVRERLMKRFGDPPNAPSLPYFTDGEIASSNILVKDVELIELWKRTGKQILAVDMESAGACKAARAGKCVVIPIRAMSDVIGLARDDEWTDYACEVAAAFALAFIRSWKTAPEW